MFLGMISTESIHGDEIAEYWMDLKLPRTICVDFARDHRTKISMIHNQGHRKHNILKRRTNFVREMLRLSPSLSFRMLDCIGSILLLHSMSFKA
jgi:hypothetical protein